MIYAHSFPDSKLVITLIISMFIRLHCRQNRIFRAGKNSACSPWLPLTGSLCWVGWVVCLAVALALTGKGGSLGW